MIIGGLNFNPRLTPLTRLKVKQLAGRYGVSEKEMTNAEWQNFMTATFCEDPDKYLDLDLDEYEAINEELFKTEEYQKILRQIQRMTTPKKKQESKTRE